MHTESKDLNKDIVTNVFDYVWVLKLLQQVNLLQEMHLLLLFEVADLNLFNCNKLPCGEIEAFENLATGPSAHYFSNLLSNLYHSFCGLT